MAADNEIHDESEYNKLVKTLKEKRETIKKWAAENGVNLSPKSIQKSEISIMSLVAIWNYGVIRIIRFISL